MTERTQGWHLKARGFLKEVQLVADTKCHTGNKRASILCPTNRTAHHLDPSKSVSVRFRTSSKNLASSVVTESRVSPRSSAHLLSLESGLSSPTSTRTDFNPKLTNDLTIGSSAKSLSCCNASRKSVKLKLSCISRYFRPSNLGNFAKSRRSRLADKRRKCVIALTCAGMRAFMKAGNP
jgi:hypothetical protein